MKMKLLMLTSIFSINSSIFAANPMTADPAGGSALANALRQVVENKPLSHRAAAELSGALFQSEVAALLLQALETRGRNPSHNQAAARNVGNGLVDSEVSIDGDYYPSKDPTHGVDAQPPVAKDLQVSAEASNIPQEGMEFVMPGDRPQAKDGKKVADGLQISRENLSTKTFDDFKITDAQGNEIPAAKEILKILKLFARSTAEVSEEFKGPKLLYLYGDAGKGKTTAAVILMHELMKRDHHCLYVASSQIDKFDFDLAKLTHSLIVIDDFNLYPQNAYYQKRLIDFILAAYEKPSVRIIITSNNPLSDLMKYLTCDLYFRERWLDNAEQTASRFKTL